jgi:hypothetical protein
MLQIFSVVVNLVFGFMIGYSYSQLNFFRKVKKISKKTKTELDIFNQAISFSSPYFQTDSAKQTAFENMGKIIGRNEVLEELQVDSFKIKKVEKPVNKPGEKSA